MTLSYEFVVQYRAGQQRGRVIRAAVREQLAELDTARASWTGPDSKNWPNNLFALQRWLILNAVGFREPSIISDRLSKIAQLREYPGATVETLHRWDEALGRWAAWRHRPNLANAAEETRVLLTEGRKRYYEAAGYDRIGRAQDATGLYLWSVDALTQFLERADSEDLHTPEALYMLGKFFARYDSALPSQIRGDRLLRVLMEIYSESIWADLARNLRPGGFHDAG